MVNQLRQETVRGDFAVFVNVLKQTIWVWEHTTESHKWEEMLNELGPLWERVYEGNARSYLSLYQNALVGVVDDLFGADTRSDTAGIDDAIRVIKITLEKIRNNG